MDEEIKRLEELVKQGDADAMYELGHYYLYGQKGLLENYEKAKELFEEAVNLGDARAMNILGYIYEHEFGVPQDYEKAKELYEKAANLGDTSAMNKLGYMYEHGEGVPQDYEKAKELYEKAENLRNAREINNLGYMYQHGEGVSQDYGKAKELFEKAANLGNTSAMYNLGYMYENGEGVPKDYSKAKELYEKAATKGNKVAQEKLSKIKASIEEARKNNNDKISYYKDKSIEELEELVKQNDDKAMNELGRRYSDGEGVEKNLEKAKSLFQKSSQLNNPDAMTNLGQIYLTMEIKSIDDLLKNKQNYIEARKLFEQSKIIYEKLYEQSQKEGYLNYIKHVKTKLSELYLTLETIDTIESSDKKDKEVLQNDVIAKPKVNEEVEKLKSLVKDLNSKYISREQTVRMLANNIYHGRRVIKEIKDSKTVRDNISTILLISSTGGGKTAIVSDLAKEFNVPFTSVSLSAGYTQAGYKGLDLQSIFTKLINVANGDVEKAQEGIIILDEFDKIRTKEDSHDEEFKRALQQELLSYLEGREVQLDTKGGPTTFNTSKLTFILAGAFQDITEYDMNYTDEDIKDAISKGYESELLGRIGIYHYMPKYTKEDYISILNNSKISPLSNFIVSCSIHGKNVVTSPYSPFIESVAEEAVKLDKGVRGLNSIFANILNWYLDDLIYGENDISLMESYETIKKKKGRGK